MQLAALKNVSNNAAVREAQAQLLSVPKTGMAVTIDIGDPDNVHPKNKEPLGERLTAMALANVYGRKVEYSGPVYLSMKVEGGAVRVKFTHAAGLMAKDGELKWFQIAGADEKFVDAEAKIEGDTVVVRSAEVALRWRCGMRGMTIRRGRICITGRGFRRRRFGRMRGMRWVRWRCGLRGGEARVGWCGRTEVKDDAEAMDECGCGSGSV